MIHVIKRPIITEKAAKVGSLRQYVFEVTPDANKIQIKQAIEKMFDVAVADVRTVRVKGKRISRYTRKGLLRGSTPLVKKAYVTLKEGQAIDIVSGEGSSSEE